MRIHCATALTALLVVACEVSGASPSPGGKRPLTLDALLQQKNWGPALIDPTGRWLVFEQTPAYDHLPDYGIDWSSPGQEAFGEIMVIDLTVSDAPRPLFQPEPQTVYRTQSFSPDGSCVALHAAGAGKISLAVYELPNGPLRTFKETPELASYETTLVWTSQNEIVYTALPNDQQPLKAARSYIGNQLYQAWNRSWQGKEPSVTEIASHANGRHRDVRAGMLVRASCRTGTTEQLAQSYFTDLAVSSDGRFVAGLRQAEILQPPPDGPVTDDWTRHQLVVVELKTGNTRTVGPELYVSPSSIAWSPTANELGFFAWKTDADSKDGLFHTYDARAEKIRTWPTEGLDVALGFSYTRPGRKPEQVAWLGGRLALFTREYPKKEATPPSGDPALAGSEKMIMREGKGDWFLLSPEGGRLNLTAEFAAVSPIPVSVTSKGLYVLADGNVVKISPDRTKTRLPGSIGGLVRANNPLQPQSIALTAQAQGKSSYVLLDFAGGAERSATIVAPSEHARLMDGSARAGAALFREDTDEGSRFLLQRAHGAPIDVGRVNEYLAEFARPEWKTISYRISNDQELRSGMFLPYGYDSAKRYPVVVVVYPGTRGDAPPVSRIGESFGFYAPQLIAANGYIVFFASTPNELQRTDQGPIAGMTDLVLAGVNALVARGYADPDRICLFGNSQGGISSLWLATQTDRFKAVVSINGWADMETHYLDTGNFNTFYTDTIRPRGMGYYDSVRGSSFGIGRTPWQDPDVYVRNSPVWQAHRIKTPILLIHSDMDGFEGGQYERMFNALYRLRKEARLVRYWGEGHGPSSPANIRDLYQRVFAWCDEWADVTRDGDGNMIWEGDRLKLRSGIRGR